MWVRTVWGLRNSVPAISSIDWPFARCSRISHSRSDNAAERELALIITVKATPCFGGRGRHRWTPGPRQEFRGAPYGAATYTRWVGRIELTPTFG